MSPVRYDALLGLSPTQTWRSICASVVFCSVYLEIVAVGVVCIPKEGRWCYAPVLSTLVDLLVLPVNKARKNTTRTQTRATR